MNPNTPHSGNYDPDQDPAQQASLPQQGMYPQAQPQPLQAPYQQPQHAGYQQQPQLQTPFADSYQTMPQKRSGGGKAALWGVLGAVGALILAGVAYMAFKGIQDPFRTLDNFPVEKFLANHQSVLGSRFKADLVVDAELGGAFDKGRLMSFRDDSTQKVLALLVGPESSQVGFTKGQRYQVEVEVKEGGLIYAHQFKKF